MKYKGLLCLILALLLLMGIAVAENRLDVARVNGELRITWSVVGDCELTVYRNGWPVSVQNVSGASGGTTVPAAQEGKYSVRLRTASGCLTAAAVENEEVAPVPTKLPVLVPQPTLKPTEKPVGGQRSDTLAAQVVAEVNAERAKRGLSQLTVDDQLTQAACIRATEIVEKFSHTRPDGTKWSTVSSIAYGENIAKGHNSANRVMAAWMSSSEGHRENILRASYGSIGVCALKVDGVLYWVQLFGK